MLIIQYTFNIYVIIYYWNAPRGGLQLSLSVGCKCGEHNKDDDWIEVMLFTFITSSALHSIFLCLLPLYSHFISCLHISVSSLGFWLNARSGSLSFSVLSRYLTIFICSQYCSHTMVSHPVLQWRWGEKVSWHGVRIQGSISAMPESDFNCCNDITFSATHQDHSKR
jgi:hypothetical protein